MLKIAYSWLLNAQIARTAIWMSSWKVYFSSAAAAWLRSSRARHGALAGRRIAVASFGTLTGRRRGGLIGGAGTILIWLLAQERLVPAEGAVAPAQLC